MPMSSRKTLAERGRRVVAVRPPGDRLEREADRRAAQALRPQPGRGCACGGGCPRCGGSAALPALHGAPLDAATRRFFEPRLGADFSQVRVFSDAAAARAAHQLGAAAYTHGRDIVFGADRYAPGTRAGRELLAHELAHVQQQAGMAEPPIQRQAVGTNYGEFKTTLFQDHPSGVEIVLEFMPDKAKVDATKIALVQSVKATTDAGTAYAVNPTIARRMAPAAGPGAGFAIDASGASNVPLYFDLPDLAAGKALKDTPAPAGTVVPSGNPKRRTSNHDFGSCTKLKPKDPERTAVAARLWDRPEGMRRAGAGMAFETTALAIDGRDAGRYYGSVKWSYTIVNGPSGLTGSGTDIAIASPGNPTADFSAAASLWNTGTKRGTLVVAPLDASQPDAWVQNVVGTGGRLTRGTQLRLIDQVKGSTDAAIKAEVLDAAGRGTGRQVLIYVTDVLDQGGGAANVPLPLPP